jgi:hypothetical protein
VAGWQKFEDGAAPVDANDIVTAQFEGADDSVALTLQEPPPGALQAAWRDLAPFPVWTPS